MSVLRCAIVLLCLLASNVVTANDKVDLSQFYGFTGVEIFKLSTRSASMVKGDFNSDGRIDVLAVDNSKSRLDLLQQRAKKPDPASEPKTSIPNPVKNDWRFEHIKIPVDKQVAALTQGDFDNDGKNDIAYLGAPDRLIVRYQQDNGDWTRKFSIRVPNVTLSVWSITGGDLNNDKLDDIVVVGKTLTYILYQTKDGKFGTPVRLMNTSNKLGLVNIADMDGDSRNDLCYLSGDANNNGLCARLQDADGNIGPELRFDLQRPRGVTLYDIDGEPGTEVLAISAITGRVHISQLRRPEEKSGELPARLIQYGFGEPGSGKDRDLAVGDVDGDGLSDVVVTDPAGAQILVFKQQGKKGLDSGSTYPGLLGAEQLRVTDLDNDKRAEVIVLSAREKALAISKFVDGRLEFPQAIPVGTADESPAAFETADVNNNGKQEIVTIIRRREGRSSKYELRIFEEKDGKWDRLQLSDEPIMLSLKTTPARIVKFEANGDDRPDFMVFYDSRREPYVLVSDAEAGLKELVTDGGFQLGELEAGSVYVSRQNTRSILVSQETFARSLTLTNNRWRVLDQYNAAETGANISGATEVNLDGQPGDEIVLVDTGVKKLRVLRKSDNVFRPWREVELGSLDFRSSAVEDLNGDGRPDLLLFGGGRFAVLYAEQSDPILKEVASFESKLERIYFTDLVAGDLNADGTADIAVLDTRSKNVELLNYDAKHGLRHALNFKIFEEKRFSREAARGSEPREAIIADVTADGRADLLVLTHNRVLLYPQDPGTEDSAPVINQ